MSLRKLRWGFLIAAAVSLMLAASSQAVIFEYMGRYPGPHGDKRYRTYCTQSYTMQRYCKAIQFKKGRKRADGCRWELNRRGRLSFSRDVFKPRERWQRDVLNCK